jgi:predicted membrane-bound spermidine synthase
LNIACAVVVLPLVPRLARAATAPAPAVATVENGPAPTNSEPSAPFLLWAAIAALSGWLALSLEIVWFRLLGVMVKSTAFTFGTLLTTYLTGLGLGSLAGSALARTIRRPAIVFLALQSAVGLSAAALVAIVVGTIDSVPRLQDYFGGYEPHVVRESVVALRQLLLSIVSASPAPQNMPRQFIVLYIVLPSFLIVLPTFMMGFSFPILQRVVQTDLAHVGRRVGQVLVANIAGSVAGTVLTGWLLLDTLGTAGTLKLLAGFSSLFVLVGFVLLARARRPTVIRASTSALPLRVGVGMALVGVLVATPNAVALWSRLHGSEPDRLIFGEDASGLSVLRLEKAIVTGATVFVNGVGQSKIPYGDVHTALGMLPAFLHPDPMNAAIIGLGSGDTLYGLAGRPELDRIVSIEIIRPQLDTLRAFAEREAYPGVLGILSDPRIVHVAGDGRAYLMHAGGEFDIIEADALRPTSAYSGNLFSEEYFTLVRSRLRPGGIAATWSPTERVHNAFVRVFPHVVSVPGVLLGSDRPIEINRETIAARLADPRVRDHYSRAGVDIEKFTWEYLANPTRYTPDFNRAALTDFNTDLFPKDEFDLSTPP